MYIFAAGYSISKIATSIEPTDGIFCKGIVRYNHLNGQVLEHLGLAPKIKILMFDCGGKVDTLSFNRRKDLKRLYQENENTIKEALDYLKTLHHQKIFLFGTAGFGKSDNYFKKIIDKVKESIDESNEVIGSFMCQGKMPETVLQRYLKLKEGNHAPDNINLLIDNYYEALKHPNNDDIENLKKAIA